MFRKTKHTSHKMLTSIYFAFVFGVLVQMNGAVFNQGCNPLHCFSIFDSLFVSNENTSCSKTSKLLECASKCSRNSSKSFIIEGLESLNSSLCSEFYTDDSTNVNKCIFRQRFSILACIYSYSSLEAEDPDTDARLLRCKKILDVGSCSTLNVPCTARASHVSNGLLSSLFNSFLDECHDLNTLDIAYLKVKPLNTKDYSLLGSCLDENNQLITQCLSKWIDFQNDSCRSMKFFTNCMQVLVQNKCHKLEDVFVELSQMFLSNINFFSNCNKNSELQRKKGAEILNESTKNIPGGREDIKKTSIFSTAPPKKVTDEIASDETSHNSDGFRTFDPIYQIINNTQNLKQFFDENEETELPSQIVNPSTDKSSNGPFEPQPKEKNNFNEKNFKSPNENLESNSPSSSPNTPPNSSNPIIIHKTTYITLTYRAKSEGNNVSAVIMLIGLFLLSLFLHSKFL